MKIIMCDACHANVNDYSYWYGGTPRNMYELKCVHDSNDDTYDGMIICHECIAKLLHKTESDGKLFCPNYLNCGNHLMIKPQERSDKE